MPADTANTSANAIRMSHIIRNRYCTLAVRVAAASSSFFIVLLRGMRRRLRVVAATMI
jgi:hypothetical protein